MPYKDPNQQRLYAKRWIANRRKNWMDQHGPCIECRSCDNLCLHHKNKDTKISHKIWSWSQERRMKELSKCVVMCEKCHNKLHGEKKRKVGPIGTLWCSKCQMFKKNENFTKQPSRWNGHHSWCKQCRSKYDNKHRRKMGP